MQLVWVYGFQLDNEALISYTLFAGLELELELVAEVVWEKNTIGWLEADAGAVWEKNTVGLEAAGAAERSESVY